MGLPLYRAPVDSGVKAKVPKDPPTRARSTIRRNRHNVHDSSSRPSTNVQYYARRVGLGPRVRARVISPPTAESPWTPWDNIEPSEPDATSRSSTRHQTMPAPYSLSRDNTTQGGSGRPEPVLREVITRNGPMSQEVVRYFGEHMARLYAGTSSRGTQDSEGATEGEGRERSSTSLDDEAPSSLERTEPFSQRPPTLARESTTRSRSDRDARMRYPADLLRRQNERLVSMRRTLRAQEFAAMREAREIRRQLQVGRVLPPASSGDTVTQESRFDGLGDRDRSLSPEGDGVWDTLLSSITPDPQPPSVVTSFASTPAPASAGTSQSTASAISANSSHTSLIDGPDGGFTPQEVGFAEVCESGGDNSDTEGDEDEEARDNTLRRFGQSYADLTGRADDDDDDNDLEVFGGVESMQRIVRNFARRQDIPDEWWAEAGLSRTLGG